MNSFRLPWFYHASSLPGLGSRNLASALVGLAQQSSAQLETIVRLWVAVLGAVVYPCSGVPSLLIRMEVREQVGHAREGLRQELPLEFDGWELLAVPRNTPLSCDDAQQLPLGGPCSSPELRSGGCSSCGVTAAEHGQQVVDPLAAREVFGEEIRWILLTTDFDKFNCPIPHSLLDPKALCVDMSELAKPLSTTNAYSRRAVGPHAHWKGVSEVFQQGLVPEADAAGFHHSIKLRLAAT